MKYQKLAIWALAAVHLLVFLLMHFRRTQWPTSWTSFERAFWIDSICFSVILAQGFLVGLWAAIGSIPTAERAVRILAMKHPITAIISAMAFIQLLVLCLLVMNFKLWYELWASYYLSDAVWPQEAIAFSQGSLLGLWVSHGGKPKPWRAVVFLLIAAVLGFPSAEGFAIRTPLIEQAVDVMAVLLLLRFLGLRLIKADPKTEDRLQPLQFSVGQALSWLTASVIFMSAMQYLKYVFAAYFQNNPENAICVNLSSLGVALAAMWLSLGNKWIIIRCLAQLAVIVLGARLVEQIVPWRPWTWTMRLSLQAAVTAESLLVVRLAGYNLMWHWSLRRPSHAEPQASRPSNS